MENTSTRTPKSRAITKWPHSWTKTITPSPIATAMIPVSTAKPSSTPLLYPIDLGMVRAHLFRRLGLSLDFPQREPPRFRIRRQHIANRAQRNFGHAIPDSFDHRRASRTPHA